MLPSFLPTISNLQHTAKKTRREGKEGGENTNMGKGATKH
jgi:hypothetical protein